MTNLSIERTVEIFAGRVLSWSSVITSNDEMSRTKVLSNDRMPDSFSRTGHSHSQRKKSESGHSVGVRSDDRFVDSDLRVTISESTSEGGERGLTRVKASTSPGLVSPTTGWMRTFACRSRAARTVNSR